MRAMRADEFSGYERLRLVDLPKPTASDGKVLLQMTAAGVTPLDHTILSGQYPLAKRCSSWVTKERAWWSREAQRTFLSVHA